ncbi:nucleoside hydrolase [Selenihalanaerobacter shriftii]|uniref:Inosine-uridine nucleoside N-ribohydrolase n=1 Tax=Selenihalanaerobacter shriftii TaxID=142842 RepID=A0A1T4K4Y7_9FIRM|nr:nucleoside hydrolase [Selenihalanaerobacter shriftii]SJZ37494.1 Inosine-uridine nucleoside N-ribohydrolase [Selenihalanaerobacter shriftii]
MQKILFDCDNTMGLQQKDVDDGLVLIYLLGCLDIDLLGVTSVFGNGSLKDANQVTKQMYKDLEVTDIPFNSGAADSSDIQTDAASFLVKIAKENPGKITLLATGPLTNLKAAYKLDSKFFSYLKEIVIMGGITDPLYFGDKEVEELNFSCDPKATELILKASVPITVATGNLCLQAFFDNADWQRLQSEELSSYQYIFKNIKHWYEYNQELIGRVGFYMWDLVSALYVTHPELYSSKYYNLKSTEDDLNEGKLILEEAENRDVSIPGLINIPAEIKDINRFKDAIFDAWQKVKVMEGN